MYSKRASDIFLITFYVINCGIRRKSTVNVNNLQAYLISSTYLKINVCKMCAYGDYSIIFTVLMFSHAKSCSIYEYHLKVSSNESNSISLIFKITVLFVECNGTSGTNTSFFIRLERLWVRGHKAVTSVWDGRTKRIADILWC